MNAQALRVTVNAAFPPVSYMPGHITQYTDDFLKYVASNPYVDGISVPLLWNLVDKGPGASGGQYQWSRFETAIEPYVQLGRTINLIVWPVSEVVTNANFFNAATPSYVINSVDVVTCTEFPGNGTRTGGFPVVWESAYINNYKAFIREVFAHYRGNPQIGYIRIGLTVGGEIYPFCETQVTPFLPPGTSFRDEILQFEQDMLAFETAQNPGFTLLGPMTGYEYLLDFPDGEASNAIAAGIGFGTQGLNAADITGYPQCATDWCNMFAKYAAASPAPLLELQTVAVTDPSGSCTPKCTGVNQQRTGPLPPLLSFAVGKSANTFEIQSPDLLVAFDPNYPKYPQYHAWYASAIRAVHSGAPSALAISPAVVDFGSSPPGTPGPPQTVTLTNTASHPVSIGAIQISGDFAETDTCARQALSAGMQCHIIVTFTPAASHVRSGAITILDDDPWSPQQVNLVGMGSALSFSPASLNLGAAAIGAHTTQTLTVTNHGAKPVSISRIVAPSPYSARGDCAQKNLLPNGRCTLNVMFTPLITGLQPGKLVLTDTDSGSPQAVKLTAIGTSVSLSVAALNFNATVGSSSVQTLTLTNTGATPLTVVSIETTGDYSATSGCLENPVPPGLQCSMAVKFTPTAVGVRTGTLRIVDGDITSPQVLTLTGAGH